MSAYTLIKPDGTREVIKYNPKHDGPVSERLTLLKKSIWCCKRAQSRPGDQHAGWKARLAKKALKAFDKRQKKNLHRHSGQTGAAPSLGVNRPVPTPSDNRVACTVASSIGLMQPESKRSAHTSAA